MSNVTTTIKRSTTEIELASIEDGKWFFRESLGPCLAIQKCEHKSRNGDSLRRIYIPSDLGVISTFADYSEEMLVSRCDILIEATLKNP